MSLDPQMMDKIDQIDKIESGGAPLQQVER